MRDDLLELFCEVVVALGEAHAELVTLRDNPAPLPDTILKQLEERDAMAATLRAIADPDLRAGLVESYREHAARTCRTDDGTAAAVDEDVMRALEAVEESIRRRRVLVRELDDALRGAPVRDDFAGC